MASNRIGRINEEIQREAGPAAPPAEGPRVQKTMVSITHVETTPDLRYAKVYVSLLDRSCAKEVLAGLKSSGGFLRRALGKSLQLRYTPELQWREDDSIVHGAHILDILSSSTSRRIRKMKQLTIREAADFLLRNDNYVLLTHRRPDSDTIGSAAALCAGLRSLSKTAHVLENPQFTGKFRPWLSKLTCETLPSSACVVSVDIAAENLLPFDLPDCAVELQIDHHAGNRQFGLQAFVDASAATCGRSSCGCCSSWASSSMPPWARPSMSPSRRTPAASASTTRRPTPCAAPPPARTPVRTRSPSTRPCS